MIIDTPSQTKCFVKTDANDLEKCKLTQKGNKTTQRLIGVTEEQFFFEIFLTSSYKINRNVNRDNLHI